MGWTVSPVPMTTISDSREDGKTKEEEELRGRPRVSDMGVKGEVAVNGERGKTERRRSKEK